MERIGRLLRLPEHIISAGTVVPVSEGVVTSPEDFKSLSNTGKLPLGKHSGKETASKANITWQEKRLISAAEIGSQKFLRRRRRGSRCLSAGRHNSEGCPGRVHLQRDESSFKERITDSSTVVMRRGRP